MAFFCIVVPCCLAQVYRRFRRFQPGDVGSSKYIWIYSTCRVGTFHFVDRPARRVAERSTLPHHAPLFYALSCFTNYQFLEKLTLSLTHLRCIKYCFCSWDFFIWCHIVFSSQFNTIVNSVIHLVGIYLRVFHRSYVIFDIFYYPSVL
jgi:hypothetical protein